MDPVTITLVVFVIAIVMFVWEKIPLALTSIIMAMTLVLTGVITPAQGFGGFVNNNVIIFFGMFVVGGALFETGAAAKIGGMVTRFAKSERQTIVILMITTGLVSGFLSSTATAAMFIPVVLGISASSGIARSKLLLPMAYATSMGSSLTLIATPPNLIANSVLQEVGYSFGFFEFAIIGVPRLGFGILYFYFIGYKFLPNNTEKGDSIFDDEIVDYSHIPEWKRIASIVVLVVASAGMALEGQIGIPMHVVSTICAISLVLMRVITEKQAYRSVDMSVIFLFAGTLALAAALDTSGAAAVIANTVIGFLGENPAPFAVMVTIIVIAGVLTQSMSNTAATAVLAPVALSIAINMNMDPRAVLMAVVTGSSISYASPIATPPNTMIYGIGGYKFVDYIKNGIPVIIYVFIITIIILPIFYQF